MLIQSEAVYEHWQNRLGSAASWKWVEKKKKKHPLRSHHCGVFQQMSLFTWLKACARSEKLPPVHLHRHRHAPYGKNHRVQPLWAEVDKQIWVKKKLFWKDVQGRRDVKKNPEPVIWPEM